MVTANALTNQTLGGPGASGFDAVLRSGEAMKQGLLSPQFNLVGFDPRGVKSSDIDLDCFPGRHADRDLLQSEINGHITDDTSPLSLHDAWELGRGWGERCTAVQQKGRKSKYVNSVAVAYDMLRFSEVRAQSLGQPREQSKLWYYGVSYGTTLGTTFATLFPDRIGGMVLDGVMDADDYYAGGSRIDQVDTNKAADTFFSYCFEAGPDHCPFYGNASGPEKIKQRFKELPTQLGEHPIVVSDPEVTSRPRLVGSEDVKSLFVQSLYNALETFPSFATTLMELEQRDATSLFRSSGGAGVERPLNETRVLYDDDQTQIQTICADANGHFNVSTFEQYVALDTYFRKLSFYGGEGQAFVYAFCRGLKIEPPKSQVLNGKATGAPMV